MSMDTNKIISFIKRDIKKLEREQRKEKEKTQGQRGAKIPNGYLLSYLITRKNTLKEILKMLEK